MSYANPIERAELISGFRALADYLEVNPDIPAPYYADVYAFPPNGECAQMRGEVDTVAELLGKQAHERAGGRQYTVTRSFGPVGYHAVAICKQPCHADAEEETE
jgi:hypothetical protein